MPELPIFFIFIVFFFGVVTLIIVASVKSAKGATDHLRLLGEQLGVTVTGGEPYLPSISWLAFIKKPVRAEGEYRGGTLKVWHFTRGSGKNSSPYIGLRLEVPNPRELSFQFHKEGFFSKVGKAFGMQDVSVGDPRFDKTFMVKCSDPDFIRMALLPEIMEKFHHTFETHGAKGTLKLKGNELYYEEGGRIRSEALRERFVALADVCADLRETVSVYGEGI